MTSRRTFLGLSGATLAAPVVGGCGGGRAYPVDSVPRSPFNEDSTAEDVTEGIDLTGKIAVVTGCTSGIGYETMRVLASRGCYVIGTGRSLERTRQACRSVIGLTTPVQLELSDFDSVVECAESIRSMNLPIDILVCNAGYRGGGNSLELVDGIEKHFIVNHLGHFVLVNRLLEHLYYAWQGRIVVVASRTAYRDVPAEGIRLDDLGLSGDYSDRLAYGQSKLANVLFSFRLGQLLKGTRITSNALHPGVINTDIDRNLSAVTRFGFGLLTRFSGKTIEQGAATSCYVATSPDLGATSGHYFEDCNAVTIAGDNFMRDQALAEKLFDVSTELAADYLVEQKRPDRDPFGNGSPRRDVASRHE
ncbi:MAG: SDR family NAD(P)-dependent oxidoreductase [Woeseiaceae bacterium]|nr:SDR family NAD(P)-dependent oxidoreductase [Woeseiaceae bacterium]